MRTSAVITIAYAYIRTIGGEWAFYCAALLPYIVGKILYTLVRKEEVNELATASARDGRDKPRVLVYAAARSADVTRELDVRPGEQSESYN